MRPALNAGFTLLEMVVVLVLLGVATALTMPAVIKMHEASVNSNIRNQINAAFNALPVYVLQSGQEVYLTKYPENPYPLPQEFSDVLSEENVTLALEHPLQISPLGFCVEETKIWVSHGSWRYRLVLRSPDCRVVNQNEL